MTTETTPSTDQSAAAEILASFEPVKRLVFDQGQLAFCARVLVLLGEQHEWRAHELVAELQAQIKTGAGR